MSRAAPGWAGSARLEALLSNINDTKPIHPLRQRMIEDMTLRGHSPGTQRHHVRTVRAWCSLLGIKPGDLTGELARSYLPYLQGTDVSYMTINGQAPALRFFLRVTLGQREDAERVPLMARAKSLPTGEKSNGGFGEITSGNYTLRDRLSRDQNRAVNAILACRTAQLGGHVTRCEDCAAMEVAHYLPQPALPEMPGGSIT